MTLRIVDELDSQLRNSRGGCTQSSTKTWVSECWGSWQPLPTPTHPNVEVDVFDDTTAIVQVQTQLVQTQALLQEVAEVVLQEVPTGPLLDRAWPREEPARHGARDRGEREQRAGRGAEHTREQSSGHCITNQHKCASKRLKLVLAGEGLGKGGEPSLLWFLDTKTRKSFVFRTVENPSRLYERVHSLFVAWVHIFWPHLSRIQATGPYAYPLFLGCLLLYVNWRYDKQRCVMTPDSQLPEETQKDAIFVRSKKYDLYYVFNKK